MESPSGELSEGERSLRADVRRNRARILEAAWRLLAVKDPMELSMEEVARDADIGKGTLYRHYPTKESLMGAVVRDGSARILAQMRDHVPPEADAATKLRTIVALMYDLYDNYHISFDLLASTWLCARETGAGYEHPIELTIDRVAAIVEQGVREGLFRPINADYAAAAIFSIISPIAYIKQRKRLGCSRAVIEEYAIDFILRSLAMR